MVQSIEVLKNQTIINLVTVGKNLDEQIMFQTLFDLEYNELEIF